MLNYEMKKIIKISTIGLLGIFALSLLFVQYLKTDFNDSFSQSDIEGLQDEIQSAKELPDQFVKIYNDIYPITNTSGILYDWTFEDYDRDCPCLHVTSFRRDLTMNKSRITGNRYVLAWKLEKEVTQQQCLNYLSTQFDFLYNNIGIEEASRFYFDSSVDSLTEKQMKTFVLMFRNPALNNPKRNPDRVEQELKKLRTELVPDNLKNE